MKRRSLLEHVGQLGAALTAPWLGACATVSPLTVGIHPWIGYETLRLASTFHRLSESVLLYETKDLSDSAALMQAGKLDAACTTLDEVLRLRAGGVPLTVALVFDVSEGGDAVIARPQVRNLSDLARKRIGVEKGALGFLMLGELLKACRLERSAITVVDVSTDRQLQAWRNGEIDAAITYEPVATLLQREGGVRLFDSRQVPDTILDVLAVRTDRVAGNAAALRALVRGHFHGLSHLNRHREDATYRIATTQGISPAEVRQAIRGVRLPSLEANREYLSGKTGRLLTVARSLSAMMVRERLLAHEDPLANLSNDTWLPLDDEEWA